MRLPLIAPADLTEQQKSLYADMKQSIGSAADLFQTVAPEGTPEAGALIGPWNLFLHELRIGRAVWELDNAITKEATVPATVREIVILVTGAHFNAAYEIYAHATLAKLDKMTAERVATLLSGSRPADLSKEEGVGYDVAFALVNGSILPEPIYRLAVDTFGQHGANEIVYLVGFYSLLAITLNAFDVPAPENVPVVRQRGKLTT